MNREEFFKDLRRCLALIISSGVVYFGFRVLSYNSDTSVIISVITLTTLFLMGEIDEIKRILRKKE